VEGKLRKSVHTIEASLKTHTFDQLMINMLMMRRHEKDYMLRHDKKYIAQLHEVATQFKQHLAETVLNVSEKQRLATRLKYYQAKVNEFVQIEQDIAKSISVFRTAVHTLEPLLVEIYSEAEDHKNDAQHQIQQVVFMMKGVIILAALIIFVFGLWIALFLANSLSKPLILTVHASKLLTEGNTALTGIDREALQQLATRPDEMGELGRAFEDLASYFQTVITDLVKVSQGLAMGNLDVRPTAEYKGDFIDIKYSLEMALSNESKVVDDIVLMSDGLSSGKRVTAEAEYKGRFVQVKDGLEMASIKLENATKQQVQQDWHKTGEGKLSALMNGEQDMETLGKTIISFLTSYVDAQMGLFYLHKKDDEESYLEIIASYAYTEHENLFKKYAFGKGLVGEVALERKMQSRIYTEEDQSRITQSGLSVVVPHQIIIIPFIYEGELKGLIEIGTSTNLTTLQETFLQEVMENIGIAVNAAESRARILVILEKTKVQALALDKQQREMDQKEQEMRFFQKKLRARKLKLAEQQKEIDRQNEERSLEIH
ncbi:MAG: GAF domain-containing protein, partial [Thiomargarita sp.]|nr:GAF domain-containing protein [Thiomargarita sp.]